MSIVFADTFYFPAILNPRDQAHVQAVSHAKTFRGDIVTTSWVLTELADAMSAPANRGEFLAMLRDLRSDPHFRIVSTSDAFFDEGLLLFEATRRGRSPIASRSAL